MLGLGQPMIDIVEGAGISCSSTKANFDVRSIATMRRSLPSAIRIAAMSAWN
jgi:hypothetical protein